MFAFLLALRRALVLADLCNLLPMKFASERGAKQRHIEIRRLYVWRSKLPARLGVDNTQNRNVAVFPTAGHGQGKKKRQFARSSCSYSCPRAFARTNALICSLTRTTRTAHRTSAQLANEGNTSTLVEAVPSSRQQSGSSSIGFTF